MSFKCFISYFLGVISMLYGLYTFQSHRGITWLVITLIIGFSVSQIICFYVHWYCKYKHDQEEYYNNKQAAALNFNF